MTYPRAHTVNPKVSGLYHCVSRCVRRAWLCGMDEVTGRSYEHRKQWIEEQLLELGEVFAVQVLGYAVMSNHYHVVLKTEPDRAASWSKEEVASRWLSLCKVDGEEERRRRELSLLGNAERLEQLRGRLGNLSWFMRYVNEPLARRANREEGCSGRFWQGRFHSEVLLDEGALWAALVYVDLNPVRAGVVEQPHEAEHTGLARRLKAKSGRADRLGRLEDLGMDLSQYLGLVRWTAQGDGASTGVMELPGLKGWSAHNWAQRQRSLRSHCRVHGAEVRLRDFARALGQRWVKGVGWAPSG